MLIEVIACFMVDTLHMNRKKGTVVSTLILLVCGAAPSMSESLLNNLDNIFGCYVLPTLVTMLVVAVGYRFGGERLRITVMNTFGNGYIGKWATVLFKYLVPVVNIFLMVWFAHSNQASGIWFLGYGGLLLTWLVTLIVVGGMWWYDKKRGYQWDGMVKEG